VSDRTGEARSLKEYGYVVDHAVAGRLYCFGPESFAELMQGYDRVEAARALQRTGFLHAPGGGGRLQYKLRVPGDGSPRNVYAVKASILEGEDESDAD
jgi:hypothetical protein